MLDSDNEQQIKLAKIIATGIRNAGYNIGQGIGNAGFWIALSYFLSCWFFKT